MVSSVSAIEKSNTLSSVNKPKSGNSENAENISIFAANQTNPIKDSNNDQNNIDNAINTFFAKVKQAEEKNKQAMATAAQKIKKETTEEVIGKIIETKLNSKVDDASALKFSPVTVDDSSTGASINIFNEVNQNEISINLSLFDYVEMNSDIPKERREELASAGVIKLNDQVRMQIPQNLLTQKAKQYLQTKNYMTQIQTLQPGEEIVLETTPENNIPVVTAIKNKDGSTILNVNKNGMQAKIVIPDLDKQQADSPQTENPFSANA